MYKIIHGKSEKKLKNLAENSVDSIICDPPYSIKFMNAKWDYKIPSVEIWQQCLRVLKSGGHLIAFGGTRTYHRLVINIEDAGFDIRDCITWLYGSGFPKSVKLGDGYGTQLKPAQELICLARKPIAEKTIVKNILKHGTGGINIDGCRIEHNEPIKLKKKQIGGNKIFSQAGRKTDTTDLKANGRWPANVIHDGSECIVEKFPITGKSNDAPRHNKASQFEAGGKITFKMKANTLEGGYSDSGSAARYFYCAKPSKAEKNAGLDDSEKNNHPTVKPLKLMKYLCRLITPKSGIVLDPFMGSGTTGISAIQENFEFIGIEQEADFIDISKARLKHAEKGLYSKNLSEKLFK